MANFSKEETYDPLLSNWIKCARGLHFVRNGLESFVDEELSNQHACILKSLKVKPLVHCRSCSNEGQSAIPCNHDKVECDRGCREHCVDNILSQFHECSFVSCPNCQESFCSQCYLSSHELSLCDCTATTILAFRNGKGNGCKLNICGDVLNTIFKLHACKTPKVFNCDPRQWIGRHWEIGKCFLSTPIDKAANCADIDAAGFLSICINNVDFHGKIQELANFESVSILNVILTSHRIIANESQCNLKMMCFS